MHNCAGNDGHCRLYPVWYCTQCDTVPSDKWFDVLWCHHVTSNQLSSCIHYFLKWCNSEAGASQLAVAWMVGKPVQHPIYTSLYLGSSSIHLWYWIVHLTHISVAGTIKLCGRNEASSSPNVKWLFHHPIGQRTAQALLAVGWTGCRRFWDNRKRQTGQTKLRELSSRINCELACDRKSVCWYTYCNK